MQADRFNNDKYVDWVKTSLSLLYLKEGLTKFSDEKAGEFHRDVKDKVRLKNAMAATATCTACTPKSVFKRKSTWRMPCSDCSIWLEEILFYHKHLPLPNIAWANSNPQLWPSDIWEVAKLFQPYGCKKHQRADDSDCTALLTMMLDCTFFQRYLSNTAILQEIKDHRNTCMHSGDLEIEHADMKIAMDKMVALLDEPTLKQRPESVEARKKIIQLRDNVLDMSLNKELELRALNHRFTEVRADVDRLTAEHGQLLTDLAGITTRQDSTMEDYNKLRERVDDVDNQIAEMTKMIEALMHAQDDSSLNTKTEDLTCRLQELSRRNQQDVGDLKATMVMFEARLQDLETKKEEGHEQSTQEVEINRIQKHLLAIYKKHCQRIPIYPLRPDKKKRLENLYVEPQMIVEDPRGRHTQSQNLNKSDLKEVKSIKDLFYSDGKPCKNIIVNGEMGTGKTSLCEHLVALWVKSQTGPRPLQEDESVMSIFTVLFYISLRSANRKFESCYRVESIIASHLHLTESDVVQLMSSNECLVILDGLDELSRRPDLEVGQFESPYLPERPTGDKSVYVTTSRPFKLELLSQDDVRQIDRQIAIKGLEESSQRDLARNIVALFNAETGNNKTANDFLRYMRRKKQTKHLKSPILLTMLLGLWYDDVPVWDSQCSLYSSMIERQIKYAEKVQRLDKVDVQLSTHPDDTIPNCFMNRSFCMKYGSVLKKVSTLAYERLFDTHKENSLVFDHDQTDICGISNVELKLLLQVGILTQQRVIGGVTEELRSVSFLHKSHQEFFCAAYLSTNGNMSRLLSKVCDLDTALELEQVFVFVCGMNAEVAVAFSDWLMEIASSSYHVKNYRQCHESFKRIEQKGLIEHIQKFVLDGTIEATRNNLGSGILKLHDIIVPGYPKISTVDPIIACDTSRSKSIYINRGWERFEVESWPASPFLEKVQLYGLYLLKCNHFTDRFSAGHLVNLYMLDVELSLFQLQCLYEKLSAAEHLERVSIDGLICKAGIVAGEDSNIRLDLSRNKRLESFSLSSGQSSPSDRQDPPEWGISDISFNGDMANLQKVHMYNIRVSAACLRKMINTLPLNGVKEVRFSARQLEILDMSGLKLQFSQLQDISRLGIAEAILTFSVGHAEVIDMNGIELNFWQLQCLCEKLSAAENLKRVKVENLKCNLGMIAGRESNVRLNLSRNKRLEIFGISSSPGHPPEWGISHMSFSQDMTSLKRVMLDWVIISPASLSKMINVLPLSGVKDVRLSAKRLDIIDTNGLMLNFNQLQYMNHASLMFSFEQLTVLDMADVELSFGQFQCLFEKLSGAEHLQCVKMERLKCISGIVDGKESNVRLDLSRNERLKTFSMSSSQDHIPEFEIGNLSFHQNMTQLQTVQMSRVILSASSMIFISTLPLIGVKEVRLSAEQLDIIDTNGSKLNLCQMQQLSRLMISETSLMFSLGQLTVLDMADVELSFCQLQCLCENLSAAENLQSVRMKRLKCIPGIVNGEESNVRLDLSRNKLLESFRLSSYHPPDWGVSCICFSQDMTNLQYIEMEGVTISANILRDIIHTLPLNGVSAELGACVP